MSIVGWLLAGCAATWIPQDEPAQDEPAQADPVQAEAAQAEAAQDEAAPAEPEAPEKVGPAFRLHAHAELTQELQRIAQAYPEVASLHRVAESRGGHAIDALRLTGPGEGVEQRPAILLVTNLQGPRVFESGVALHHAEELATAYSGEGERAGAVRTLLDSTVVWILPRANPDAAEARFETPFLERWAGLTGVDNDRDGRLGENPPADLNGDGKITWMRVPDPDGEWMADPTDERAHVKADRIQGQRGVWRIVREGRDDDGDGEASEDPPGDTRVDRNFPSGWEEHAPHAGLFPGDEPAVHGLMEFVLARKNLSLVVTYDGLDNLVEEPKSVDDDAPPVKRVPPAGVLQSDAELLAEIGRRYRETTGNEAKGDDPDEGTFQRWCYDHRGLITLNAVLWNMPTEAPTAEDSEESEQEPDEGGGDEDQADEPSELEQEPGQDAKRLRWVDGSPGEEWRFVPWQTFEHPAFGPVEVGGFSPFAKLEPPKEEWGEIAEAHFDFFLTLGELVPRLSLAECTKEKLGDGLWKVTAVVQNDAYLPLLSRSARRTRTTRPARVRILVPEGARLLSGNRQELLRDLPGSGGRHEYTWLLHGPAEMEPSVSVDSDHAGVVTRKAEVAE